MTDSAYPHEERCQEEEAQQLTLADVIRADVRECVNPRRALRLREA